MAVAKSYEHMAIQGDPFKENGRMYVNVLAPKGLKKVRWYTEAEREKMDKKTSTTSTVHDVIDFDARYAFGFGDAGYITIYKTDDFNRFEEYIDTHHEYFRRNLTFGYYTPSKLLIPMDLPEYVKPITLKWEEVMEHGNKMRPHDVVTTYITKLLGETFDNGSTYQGSPNDWIERDITVTKNKVNSTHYGDTHVHTMIDKDNNVYIWSTSTKDFAIGANMRLRMKVKELKEIAGIKTTIVYYCKVI